MSSTDELVAKFEGAKDKLGVITPDALHTQLNMLTPNDWQHAAAIYTQHRAGDDGFFIEDNNGKVTIHNDMRNAQAHAVETPGQATVNDVKSEGAGVAAVLGTAFAVTTAGGGLGALALGADAVVAGAVAGSAALTAGIFVAGAGALVLGGDYLNNMDSKRVGQLDLKTARALSFDSRL